MLPILLSVPHGGTEIPPEVADNVCITAEALFDDSDAFTREIYDVADHVAHLERADIARAFVDLNRAPDDLPPESPDGVVKTATCYNEPIYCNDLSEEMTEQLLAAYYFPYHGRLSAAVSDLDLRLALDCHSMAETPPLVAPDKDKSRPLFCLSNDNGRTCPADLMKQLATGIASAFEISDADVSINDPFKAGYITRSHGGDALPWVQVEMNRVLYLAEPWFDRSALTVDPARLSELRDRFAAALRSLKL